MILPRLLLVAALLLSLSPRLHAQILDTGKSDLGGTNAAMEDPNTISRNPELLWEEMDEAYTTQQWMRCCQRLDRLRELGEDLKRKKQKAGYAYLRCANIHLRVNRLTLADRSLDISKDLVGEPPERRPVEAELHRILGKDYLFKKDLGQALAHFEIAAAKYPDTKKDTEISLLLSRYARIRYDEGDTASAKEATYAALGYYPENREAQKIRDMVEFWNNALWPMAGLGLVGVALLVYLLKRRSSSVPGHG